MSNYHHLLQCLLNRPLFAHPASAMVVFNSIADRAGLGQGGIPSTPDMGAILNHISTLAARPMHGGTRTRISAEVQSSAAFAGEYVQAEGDTWRETEPFLLTKKGTALISITGSLVNRGGYVGAQSGVTSYEGISHQLDRFARSTKAANLIIDMSTPGGEALGNAEIAAKVRAVAKVKPVYTIINSLGCSAGYGIASGSTETYGTESALIGSIGCMMLHLDMSEAARAQGVKPTLITAGDRKADGHHLVPLEGDALDRLKAEVNTLYDIFLGVVSKGRGSKLTKAMARATQAMTYIGKDAVTAGLIDDIGSFEEVLDMAEKQASKALSTSRPKGVQSMSLLTVQSDAQQPDTQQQQAVQQPVQQPAQQPAPLPAQQQQPVQAPAQPQQQAAGMDARTTALVTHAEVATNPALLAPAMQLAMISPTMTADQIIGYVKANVAPAAVQAAAPNNLPLNDLQQRVDQTNANAVPAGQQQQALQQAQQQAQGVVTAESHPWGAITAKTNERAKGFQQQHTNG